jgi:hypothetical protein
MRLDLLLAVGLLLTFNSPARSQTRAEVVREFGQPVEAYSVTERIWMTPVNRNLSRSPVFQTRNQKTT